MLLANYSDKKVGIFKNICIHIHSHMHIKKQQKKIRCLLNNTHARSWKIILEFLSRSSSYGRSKKKSDIPILVLYFCFWNFSFVYKINCKKWSITILQYAMTQTLMCTVCLLSTSEKLSVNVTLKYDFHCKLDH